jgi:hypothetical protein
MIRRDIVIKLGMRQDSLVLDDSLQPTSSALICFSIDRLYATDECAVRRAAAHCLLKLLNFALLRRSFLCYSLFVCSIPR